MGNIAARGPLRFLLLVAPSAFLYGGEGFILSRNQAGLAQRFVDSPVTNLVYEVANSRMLDTVWLWLSKRFRSLDELVLLASTMLYLVFGGLFYFGVGALLGGIVSVRDFLRHRAA